MNNDADLPTGTVTFLMTDVEGSTTLWERDPVTAGEVMERHDMLIAAAVHRTGGVLIKSKGEGDSTFSVFHDARDGVIAAVEVQRALQDEIWPAGVDLRVRAALYTGEADLRDGDYYGVAPNRGGRLRATAHGGQIVCCHTTGRALTGHMPPDVSLRDLGLHRLRDLARAEHVFQVDHPALLRDFPPLRSLAVRHNLPSPRTRLVGRELDVVAIRKHVVQERLVTLTGVGGSGKTRLAIEVAWQGLDGFPDGVFFADMAPVSDVAVVPATVAAAVGFTRMALAATELIDFLSTREVLLVLDNCEHVIDACAALVDEVLERCPAVKVLATSREALDLQGEQVCPIKPLSVDEDGPFESSAAARLFRDRASLARSDLRWNAADTSDVAEICRRLDGIPLALELAAAQTPHLSLRQISERLDDRFTLLAGGRRRAQRQMTMHATLDWSHDLLTDEERVVFRRLAVFPGPFSHGAAIDVCDAGADGSLRSLVRKSLVVVQDDGTEHRLRLLETVRAYAEERLLEAGEDAFARERHHDHFLAWAESIPPERTYLDADASIRREAHNLRAALAWSEAQGRPDLVGRLASTMNRLWFANIREGRRWLAVGLEGIDELDRERRVRVLAIAANVAVLAMQAADGQLARRAVEASEQQPGVWSSLAHSLLCLNAGLRAFLTKDPAAVDEVERLGAMAANLAQEPVSRELAAFWLGQARVLVGDFDGAIAELQKGSVEVLPDGDMSPVSLAMLAGMLHITGRHDEAFAAAATVVERSKSLPRAGLWGWVLYCSLPYALEVAHQGRHAEASSFMNELLEETGTPNTPGVMTSVVVTLAALAVLRGDDEAGALLLAYAGRILIEQGVRTPVDVALYSHYWEVVRGSVDASTERRIQTRAAEMTLRDALAYGLGASV